MGSIITHPAIPIAISALFPRESLTPSIVFAGAICSVIPDLDVIGFGFGINYEEMLGHRGLSHSIFFAAALGGTLAFFLAERDLRARLFVFSFLFLSTLSHAILDAMTNGGLGVAFFAPFQNERYFFPWRPIHVSPLGIEQFFSEWGLRVLLSELKWVWFPSLIIYTVGQSFKRFR
jgi:inner membrane protein